MSTLLDLVGPVVRVGDTEVRVGTCSWSDASLVKDSEWYPRRTMKAAQRLAYYASRFPVVQADTTYYFPPTPEVAQSWVDRTPPGFVFDVRAWSLLTGHPTIPHSLWEDLQAEVKPEFRDRRNLYPKHLPGEVMRECRARFRHALAPLHQAGRLGGVVLTWPEWFGAKDANRAAILDAVDALHPYPCFVELRRASWLDGEESEETFSFLEANGLSFVCVDEPHADGGSLLPTVITATAPLAMVRLHGHNRERWFRREVSEPERVSYLYGDDELAVWAARVRDLARHAECVHVLFANCWQDFAVRNAARMIDLLGA